jgi:hypothetical protein
MMLGRKIRGTKHLAMIKKKRVTKSKPFAGIAIRFSSSLKL